jgi:hypothetical protein
MTMIDVTWHVGKTRGQLSVTVTPYDYRMTDNHETEAPTDDE